MNIISNLPPTSELGFGLFFCPEMVLCHYKDGKWAKPEVTKTRTLELHPAAKSLHYAQEIFEGLKAFKSSQGILLFRPQENIRRMSNSAEIMAMPPFPEDDFLTSMKELVLRSKTLIPDEPGALYLRPTMIGTSTQLGVAPASEYCFFILASPVGGYFGSVKSEMAATINVWISPKHVRAAPGGVGSAKTGANYAASLRAVFDSKKAGYNNVLFLDAKEHRYLEELSGMNVFIVEKGVLKTPPLGDTILDGVTRKSILSLAKTIDLPAHEEAISVESLISGLKSGSISEAFACGTGASITGISEMGWGSERIRVGQGHSGPITNRLYKTLIDIQTGKKAPPHPDWIFKC